MVIIHRDDFMKVIKKHKRKEKENYFSFIKKIPFFSRMSQNQIKNLVLMLEEQEYQRNQFVMKQGEEAVFAYIVVSGEFEILRNKPKQIRHIRKKSDN